MYASALDMGATQYAATRRQQHRRPRSPLLLLPAFDPPTILQELLLHAGDVLLLLVDLLLHSGDLVLLLLELLLELPLPCGLRILEQNRIWVMVPWSLVRSRRPCTLELPLP